MPLSVPPPPGGLLLIPEGTVVGYWRLYFLYNILSPVATRPCAMHEFTAQITDLRNNLGFTVREVARSGNPVIVRRYDREDVILVPLAEWRRLQDLEQEYSARLFELGQILGHDWTALDN